MSNAYKSLGLEWKNGGTRVTAKGFRCSLCVSCDSDKYPRLKLSQYSGEMIDLLLYLLCGVTPATKPQDLGASTKGEARRACRRQHEVRLSRNRRRFDEIADNLSNVPQLAMRDGFPWSQLSEEMKAQPRSQNFDHQSQETIDASGGGGQGGGGSDDRLPRVPAAKALLDANHAPGGGAAAMASSPGPAAVPEVAAKDVGGPAISVPNHRGVSVSMPKLQIPIMASQMLESHAAKRRRLNAQGQEED